MPVRRATTALCLAALLLVAMTTVNANHSWGGYHWARQSNPFTLIAGDNVTAAWDAYLGEAASDWSAASEFDVVVGPGGTNAKNCRPTVGRIEVCNSGYGKTNWLGIAQIWISGGVHITQATTKLNDTYFNTATYNKPEWRRLVTCQEVAHDFGLDHQDEVFDNPNLGTCMDYTNKPLGPPSNEHPNAHDFGELSIIYAHLDSTTTIGALRLPAAMPPAMAQVNSDNPGEWGRLIRTSTNGRVQVFERDFGAGNKILTHVFWADPDADGRN